MRTTTARAASLLLAFISVLPIALVAVGLTASPPASAQIAGQMIWPVSGAIPSSTGHTGPRDNGIHEGVDILASYKTVIAAADGVVISASYAPCGGNIINIYHANGYATRYMHMSQMAVQAGQSVTQGQAIGVSGESGIAACIRGAHLHFEVRTGATPSSYGNPLIGWDAGMSYASQGLPIPHDFPGLIGSSPPPSTDPFGALDSATGNFAGVHVAGWAIDPDTAAAIGVQVKLDGNAVATVTANTSRPDVGAAHQSAGPNHGYVTDIAAAPGTHEVCTVALNVGPGANHDLGCNTAVVGDPTGSLDSLTQVPTGVRVAGWALDSDTTAPIGVHIYLDGAFQTAVTANTLRPDIGAAYQGYGDYHGFDTVIPAGAGTHTVCVYGLNVGSGLNNTTLGCSEVTVKNDPVGSLDDASEGFKTIRSTGWAVDPNTASPIDVDIYVDGAKQARVTANKIRTDVGAGFPGYGDNHGYDAAVPATVGTHSVCTYAINAGAGSVNTTLGCRSVTVLNNPVGALDSIRQEPNGIRVNGFALDPDTTAPITVHVYVDGVQATSATATANTSRPDVALAYPGYGDLHGYATLTPVYGAGTHTVCTYAINTGNGNANTTLGCKSIVISNSPFGSFDLARQEPGGIRVAGWVVDPDTAAATDVHVYVDGVKVLTTTANQSRPDVASANPGYGDLHGFNAMTPTVAAGSHSVCAYGINVLTGVGNNVTLGCKTVTVTNAPSGGFDIARQEPGGIRVSGWALDPDTAAAIDVHVYVDGANVLTTSANQSRADIGALYPGYGSLHGFSAVTPAIAAGTHTVCTYAINAVVGVGNNVTLGCKTVTVANAPVGALDAATKSGTAVQVAGWALDPDVGTAIDVHVYVDGTRVLIAPANASRADIGAAYPGYGNSHGYVLTTPAVAAGSHTVCTYGINVGPGSTNTTLGCKTVVV